MPSPTRSALILVASLPACFAFTARALAWNDRGHMLAALIAYDELKPDDRGSQRPTLDELSRWRPYSIARMISVMNMSKALCRFVGTGLSLAAAAPVLAWNDRGHMLAALVAYDELKPDVRAKVNDILKQHPDTKSLRKDFGMGSLPGFLAFARASTWPDLVSKPDHPLHNSEHKEAWHSVAYPITFDKATGAKPVETWDGKSEPVNILQAIEKNTATLSSDKTPAPQRAVSLCWTMNLITDLHQPLNAVTMYSTQFPQGDKGGKSFGIRQGDNYTNLHSYWDNVLGDSTNHLTAQVDTWKKDPSLSRKALLGIPSPPMKAVSVAAESYQVALKIGYRNGQIRGTKLVEGEELKKTPSLPSDYQEGAKKAATKRIMQAGYRLADELNRVLGK